MVHKHKGTFTIIDGLDGIGKGVVQNAITNYLKEKNLKIFDLHKFWEEHHDHPEFIHEKIDGKKNPLYINIDEYDVILSSEPTFVGCGSAIRNEVIGKNGRVYSAHMTARLYAADRAVLYKRVLLPALKKGKHIVQSRSVCTSIVYQPMQELEPHEPELTISQITKIDGNNFALANAPNLLIIPTISSAEELLKRIKGREKQDNCQFETVAFQEKVKPLYESKILRNIFESRGTKVAYLDAGISVKSSQEQAVKIFREIFPEI